MLKYIQGRGDGGVRGGQLRTGCGCGPKGDGSGDRVGSSIRGAKGLCEAALGSAGAVFAPRAYCMKASQLARPSMMECRQETSRRRPPTRVVSDASTGDLRTEANV